MSVNDLFFQVLHNLLTSGGEALSKEAQEHKGQRGAFLVDYKSVAAALSAKRTPTLWLSVTELKQLDYVVDWDIIQEYNVEEQMVIQITIGFRNQKSSNDMNAIYRSFAVECSRAAEMKGQVIYTTLRDFTRHQNYSMCSMPGCVVTQDLLKCSGCKSVYYCSRKCQKNNWRQHKTICQSLRGARRAGRRETNNHKVN